MYENLVEFYSQENMNYSLGKTKKTSWKHVEMAESRSIRMSPFGIMSSNDGASKPEQRNGESLVEILCISLHHRQRTQ